MGLTFTRRQVLKAAAATAAITTLSGCTLEEEPIVKPPESQDAQKWVKTVCRYCGVGCGILVGVANGKVVAVKGDPESSVNKGVFCVKGFFLHEIIYAKTRL
ncbi:MAG: twin-arginine translocation signal domain-containing protein, partial [Bacillota bacterium]|nr:twin-arginine translocation signal domain-containing protein [Bacillota bacterium]